MNKSIHIYSLICKHCNNTFEGHSTTSKCCSEKCYKEFFSKLYNKPIKCQNPDCDNELSVDQIKNPKSKFCSYECCKKHRNLPTFTPEQKISIVKKCKNTKKSWSDEKKKSYSENRSKIEAEKFKERIGEEKYNLLYDRDYNLRWILEDNSFDIESCMEFYSVKRGLINRLKREVWNIKNTNIHKPIFSRASKKLLDQLGEEKFKEFNDRDFIIKNFIKDNVFLRDKCADYFGVSAGLINSRKRMVWNIKVKNKTKLSNFSSKEKEVYLFLKKTYPSFDFKWRDHLNKEIFVHPTNKSMNLECDILVFKGNSMIAGIERIGIQTNFQTQ